MIERGCTPDFEEPVEIVPYAADWPDRFSRAAQELRGVFGDRGIAIEHFGSTAVTGLAAKPVIDILVGIAELVASPAEEAVMARRGYEAMGVGAVPGRLHFRRRGAPARWVNANLVVYEGDVWRDSLLIRDYLRGHPDEARRYVLVKRAAAAAHPQSLIAYSEAKAPYMAELVARARSAVSR